ncbi:tetratricopeptide repeat protein [Phenylobacterium sp. VNQ135]|uniref:tetratricopeptide repeat protein n=1 Tax=Phenylobacterium sp. VNQ135 TaxID=3400922 RepID=UPI003BFD500A
MTDLFEEVEEQLRSDRYRSLARRALPWILAIAAAALIAALAYWGWDTWRSKAVAEASEKYHAGAQAFVQGDEARARALWTEVSKSSADGYKTLALMQLAAFQQRENKTAEAVKLLDEAAAAAPDDILGDVARLKSAFAVLDTAPYTEVEARLTPLMKDGRPYRVQAREALAFAKLMAGNAAGARGDFVVLQQSLDAPDGVRARAQAAVGLIDSGAAKALPGIVRQAAAMPPPMVVPPGAVLGPQGAPQAPAQPQPQSNGPQ